MKIKIEVEIDTEKDSEELLELIEQIKELLHGED
tara:strand:+ start:1091 stop:1192 length:102 start_codon:yes stop_codon:yes gene_type:complete